MIDRIKKAHTSTPEKIILEHINRKHLTSEKEILETNIEWIIDRNKNYDHTFKNLEKREIHPDLKCALINCYKSDTSAVKLIKKKIKSTIDYRRKCLSCGVDTESALDHYLPIEKFPEFSINFKNLIPICSLCNSAKGKKYIDEENNRMFLNYYYDYDVIMNKEYLKIKIELDRGLTYFELFNENIKDTSKFEIINNHYTELKLRKKYIEVVSDLLSRIINKNKEIYFDTIKEINEKKVGIIPKIEKHKMIEKEIIKELKREYRLSKKEYGCNHIKTLVYCELCKIDWVDTLEKNGYI